MAEMSQESTPPVSVHPEIWVDDEIELLDYVVVVVRRRWLVFWGTVLCGASAGVFGLLQPRMYRSEAVILAAQQVDYLDLSNGGQSSLRRGLSQDLYVSMLGSVPIGRKVLEGQYEYELDGEELTTDLVAYFGAESWQQALDALEGAVDVESDKTGTITIAAEFESAQLAAGVANAFVEQLVAYNGVRQDRHIGDQVKFIENRTAEIQQELSLAEQALAEFQRRNRDVALATEDGGFLTPEMATQYSRLQREVAIRSALLTTVLSQYEMARMDAKKKFPDIEVLSRAEVPVLPGPRGAVKKGMIGGIVGMMMTVFLAFFLEYLRRNQASGRMEPILEELRSDVRRVRRLFGERS